MPHDHAAEHTPGLCAVQAEPSPTFMAARVCLPHAQVLEEIHGSYPGSSHDVPTKSRLEAQKQQQR